jgi:DNA-binding NarL/FixJ family response regulator
LIRVVIVDDHEMVAESLHRILDSCGDIEVVGVAGTGHEGIDAVSRLRPDVVLLDYDLPDADGMVVAAHIRAESPRTQIVILTSSGESESLAVKALEAGCSGFLGKARAIDELLAAVRAAHAGEVLISPSMLARLVPRLQRAFEEPRYSLTFRELEVLRAMAGGGSDREIAAQLTISLNTARKHVQNVIRKLGAHSKLGAVVIATRRGAIDSL